MLCHALEDKRATRGGTPAAATGCAAIASWLFSICDTRKQQLVIWRGPGGMFGGAFAARPWAIRARHVGLLRLFNRPLPRVFPKFVECQFISSHGRNDALNDAGVGAALPFVLVG